MPCGFKSRPRYQYLVTELKENRMETIVLGKTYKDKITGFSGVCTGTCFYLTGCHQALLTPPVKESGEYVEGRWFDFQRLDWVDVPQIIIDNSKNPGFGETPSRSY